MPARKSRHIPITFFSEALLRWGIGHQDFYHLRGYNDTNVSAELTQLIESPFGLYTGTTQQYGVATVNGLPLELRAAAWRQVNQIKNLLNHQLSKRLEQLGLPTFHLQRSAKWQHKNGYYFDVGSYRKVLISKEVEDDKCYYEWVASVSSRFGSKGVVMDRYLRLRCLSPDDYQPQGSHVYIQDVVKNNNLFRNSYKVCAPSYSSLVRTAELQVEHLEALKQEWQQVFDLDPEYRFLMDPAHLEAIGINPKNLLHGVYA